MGKCTVCGNASRAAGLCRKHYQQMWVLRTYGEKKKRPPKGTPLAERLSFYSRPTDSGCIEWTGALANGYGRMTVDGKQVFAHRVAYSLYVGEIPEGLLVLHSCDNPVCINPEHLRVGTDADNTKDKCDRGRQSRLRGSASANAILSEEEVIAIRKDTRSHVAVARQYGVSPSCVGAIRKGKSWRHLLNE